MITDYSGVATGNNPEYCECYGGRERRPAGDYVVLHESSVGRCVGRGKMVRNLRSPIRKIGTFFPRLYIEKCGPPPPPRSMRGFFGKDKNPLPEIISNQWNCRHRWVYEHCKFMKGIYNEVFLFLTTLIQQCIIIYLYEDNEILSFQQ
jgi:hypothetical protein